MSYGVLCSLHSGGLMADSEGSCYVCAEFYRYSYSLQINKETLV